MHVLLNASNLGATGPAVVIRDLVPWMGTLAPDDFFTLLLPSSGPNIRWSLPGNVQVQYVPRTRVRELSRMWDIHVRLARLCRSFHVDVCLTLGDIGPVDPGVPHVIYLHQPYLVYPGPDLDAALPWFERVKLRYLSHHFARTARLASSIIVQTPVMAERLVKRFGAERHKVHIVPPALPEHVQVLRHGEIAPYPPMQAVSSPLRLLFLATYYAHKNHRILPPLIAELRRRGLSDRVHFFLTLDGDRRRAEASLLARLESDRDMVTNLGRLEPEQVGSALRTADALFMPTLVETLGLIYLEAIAVHTPILAADRDFARYICGDLALYFDPLDPVSVADAIVQFLAESPRWKRRVGEQAEHCLARFAQSHQQHAGAFLQILHQVSGS